VSTHQAIAARIDRILQGISAVCFDLDGTLAETGPLKLAMWPALLRAPRVVLAWPRAVEAQRGRRSADVRRDCVDAVARELQLPPDRVDRAVAREIDRRWPEAYRHARSPPGAAALLHAARGRGLPTVVVSDYPARIKLRAMGLSFDLVVDCRALGALKPLPDGLHAAAALTGAPTTRLLFVGDRWDTDGAAAAACGARFVPVSALSPFAAADPARRLL